MMVRHVRSLYFIHKVNRKTKESFYDCDTFKEELNQFYFDYTTFTTKESLIQTPHYSIKLPKYRSTLLTAYQNNREFDFYTSFDDDEDHCVVDNCANVNIWNDFEAFIPESYLKINAEASTTVFAVNGDSNLPTGCGDVPVQWKDDEGQVYEIVLKNVLHFPKSPVKIISVVALAEQLKDDWDTWIQSRQRQSTFTWDFGKHIKTIIHGKSKLPELLIKSNKRKMDAFYSLVQTSQSANCHLNFCRAFSVDRSLMEKDDLEVRISDWSYEKCVYENEVVEEDEASRYKVVHDASIPPPPVLSIGCSVRYIKNDHIEVGTLIGIDLSDPSQPTTFTIEFQDDRKETTSREYFELV